MRKLWHIFVILLVFGWLINANRDLVHAITQMLEKVSSELDTKLAMEGIARVVRGHYTATQRIPAEDLQEAIKEYYTKRNMRWSPDLAKDAWGTRYRLAPAPTGFYVVSAGPDQKWGTSDDLRYLHSLKDLGYRVPNPSAPPY